MDLFKVIIIKDANYSYISFKRKDFISISDNGLLTIRENGIPRSYIMKDQAQIDWLKGLALNTLEKEKEMGVVERIEEILGPPTSIYDSFPFSLEEVKEIYSILKKDKVFDLHVGEFIIRFRLVWASNSTLNGATYMLATVAGNKSCKSYTRINIYNTYKGGWKLLLKQDDELVINLTESQALELSAFFKTMRENNNANG